MPRTCAMSTSSARINTVLEPGLYREVERLARAEGVSLSQKVRDLVRDALEMVEDAGWESIVERRRGKERRDVPFKEVKRRFGIK